LKLFVPCPPGAEDILALELRKLGAGSIEPASRGVSFEGDLGLSYQACLELRTASRVLLELFHGVAADENELHQLAVDYPWETVFSLQSSFSCRVTGVPRDRDPRFAALRLKDAVADRFYGSAGLRPSVDRKNPDVRIEARWDGRYARIYLNWSGAPLHERGYRLERTEAVLRETTAASVLALSGWSGIAESGGAFVDPVCGSGTLLAEAAMMAAGAPPGVHRKTWGFEALGLHQEGLWKSIRNDALIRYGDSLDRLPRITGFDHDEKALRIAKSNLRRAGLHQSIRLEQHDITLGRPASWPPGGCGLVCADPPYGRRSSGDPLPVYGALGSLFRGLGNRWRMALLAPDRKTASASFLRADQYLPVVSGGTELVLAVYERLGPPEGRPDRPDRDGAKVPARVTPSPRTAASAAGTPEKDVEPKEADPKAAALMKVLKRNLDAMSLWASKTGVSSYRIWDADMPEFNAAVDWYEGRWLHVQEFSPPSRIPPETTRRRLETLVDVLKELTGCTDQNIFLKTRLRGVRPYSKMGDRGERYIMRENGMRFYVNFVDYLDTGIFLDHRPTRSLIRDYAGNGRFLNLFAYTGTATVMAAAGGASRTVTVDVSNTYLEWSKDNLKLNGFDTAAHSRVRSDAVNFLKSRDDRYSLIFADPPTYSNGAGRGDWSVQEHHGELIRLAMEHLEPDGKLLFAENFRQFRLDQDLSRAFTVRDITRETTDPDFVRRGGAHRCWEFSRRI
jgi:23S rRNA (guanine2445-N2)-methyltransferase / 23S rRNA (guanine2069-N7)-methyltransferase